ncbi:MAG: hypothetical protein ACP5XB_27630 [Isosphaeraceae bacterium]
MRRLMRLRQDREASCWTRGIALVGIALLSGFGSAWGQDSQPISGRVVDASGAGVAGARVWAVRGFLGETESVAEAETDAHGRFSVWLPTSAKPKKEAWFTNLRRSGFDLVARGKDGRFAWLGQHNIRGLDAQNLEVVLGECTEARGRLVDQDGKPIKDAQIVPTLFQKGLIKGSGFVSAALPPEVSAELPPDVSALLSVRALADGSFVLKGLPKDTRITATIKAQGLDSPHVVWTPREPITFTLDRRPGRMTGRFKPPGQQRFEGSAMVYLARVSEEKESGGQKYSIGVLRIVPVDRDGRFSVDGLQPGSYYIVPELGSESRLILFQRSDHYRVEPGGTVNVPDIPLSPAVTVTGRVIDAQTQQDISNVLLSGWVSSTAGNSSEAIQPVRTDEAGCFRLKTLKGTLQIAMADIPAAYVQPRPDAG